MTNTTQSSRSLILAGGGLKVAFQAGVLQVWLDEAGLHFDHADGASGGIFNLAMYSQGMTGTEIANNWRDLPIWRGVSPNWRQLWKLYFASSLLSYSRWRKNILPHWRIDWDKIRASDRQATFNLYNFTTHQAEVWEPRDMTEDALVSGVSLPMWFPPVRMGGHTYIDPVYYTDANLMEAVRRGADELWIIWTVSEKSLWKNGFVANYFQIIEAAANGRFRADLKRVETNNAEIAAGRKGEFGRTIEIKILRAEVPLHYLFNFRSSRFTRAVDLGVRIARQWCERHSIPLDNVPESEPAASTTYLEFTETMKGQIAPVSDGGDTDQSAEKDLTVRLTIQIDDIDAFVSDPAHEARAVGYVDCALYGGRRDVTQGEFNLFVDEAPGGIHKRMYYRLPFTDRRGNALRLLGQKEIHDDPGFDLWSDTTTLHTTIVDEKSATDDDAGTTVAAGVIKIHMTDFAKQLTTFRARGPTLSAEFRALGKFGKLFMGALWEVYRHLAERDVHHKEN